MSLKSPFFCHTGVTKLNVMLTLMGKMEGRKEGGGTENSRQKYKMVKG